VKYDEKREYVRKRGLFVAYTGQWGKRKRAWVEGEKVSVLYALCSLYNIMLNPTTTPPTKTLAAAETAPTRPAELLGVWVWTLPPTTEVEVEVPAELA
jgi:hypothetical protein